MRPRRGSLLLIEDPSNGKKRRRKAFDDRGVWLAPQLDGVTEVSAVLSTEAAEALYDSITRFAQSDGADADPHDHRTMDQRRADALADLVTTTGRGGVGSVAATVINVTIPIDSLAGLSDMHAEVDGLGPIPAHLARRLAGADSRWRHILTDATNGAVIAVGSLSYRPPAALARHVQRRDGTCRFPSCCVPAARCDLDHTIPFPEGPTSPDNLHALCRRHHRLKHETDWEVEALPNNQLKWTSPLGTTHITEPQPAVAVA